jgi:hypothetical protein
MPSVPKSAQKRDKKMWEMSRVKKFFFHRLFWKKTDRIFVEICLIAFLNCPLDAKRTKTQSKKKRGGWVVLDGLCTCTLALVLFFLAPLVERRSCTCTRAALVWRVGHFFFFQKKRG